MRYIPTVECHSAVKRRKWNAGSNVDGPLGEGYHTKGSKMERGRGHVIALICGIYIRIETDPPETGNKIVITRGER